MRNVLIHVQDLAELMPNAQLLIITQFALVCQVILAMHSNLVL